MDSFINQQILQNCGDILVPIEKIDSSRYRGNFLKYPYNIIFYKSNALKGTVNNPKIEEIEFVSKIWPQHCGDSLRIIKKTNNKDKDGSFLWECQFIGFSNIILSGKSNIKGGRVYNYELEKNFINNIYTQIDDSLKVLEKSSKKINSTPLYKCEFQKYKNIIFETKNHILRGRITNPKIEEEEFINKIWKQNCGDNLKIISKDKDSLFKCEFQKYPYICFATKGCIKDGTVDNKNLPYKSKENLQKYIEQNFKEKPTLRELSLKLNKSRTRIGKIINDFNLGNYITYWISNSEKEILEQYKKYGFSKYQDANYEIDIYNKELKFGIEFNGNFWHSNDEKFGKENDYHQKKSLYFKEKGIKILHIFEYEWNIKENILKSIIDSKIGLFIKKIGARKCKIKELSYKEYSDFCNENHLQGECGAKVKLGLYYKDELVQVMSFGVPRFTDKYEWEIIRECSKLGYCILGGEKRLWKYFINNYNPINCISYCDFSKFDGNSYIKLGFKLEKLNKAGFVWFDTKSNSTYWRDPFHNKEMKEKGYLKIYDCGQLVFVWNKI